MSDNTADGASTTRRLRTVEDLLRERREVQVADLVEQLGVSAVTVRRYLTELEERGVAHRTHGGAVLIESSFTLPGYLDRQAANREEKLAIARAAATLVPEEGSLILGGGTTTLQVMTHIADRTGLTILTPNLAAAAQARANGARVIVLGGEVRGHDCAMVGEFTRMTLRTRYVDLAVIGADGLSPDAGLTSSDEQERELVELALERTRGARICVVDHTKLGRVAPCAIAPADALTDLVTDAKAPTNAIASLKRLGVKVHIAT